jgi:hypothetical protein
MNLNQAMKTRPLQIRNAAFYVMLPSFFLALLGLFGVSIRSCGIPSMPLALAGLAVVLLTIRLEEGSIQKCFFIVAGASGAGLAITLIVFDIMRMLGCPPGGDGGGITLPMILLCPPLFIIGAVGSIVFLVKDSGANNGMP